MKSPKEKRSTVLLGVSAGAILLVAALLYSSDRLRRPAPFPAEIFVAFVGKTTADIVGESSVVEPNGKPDVAFRLTVKAKNGTAVTITRVTIMSSDSSGRYAGGGRWDTSTDGIRALGVMRDGKVVNAGSKRPLEIPVSAPTALDLYVQDGGMTSWWKHFALKVEADGRYEHSVVLESGTWRTVAP